MLRKLFTATLIFVASLAYSQAYSQNLIQNFVSHPALKHASIGVSVVDMTTGRSVVSHNAEASLTPASVLKLITSATALEMLGDNWRYKTEITLDASDPSRILVIGAGDPTLGSDVFGENPNAFFVNSAVQIKKALPQDREYSILVVDNLFGYDGVSPEWTWIDLGNYYAPGVYGVSVFDNSYRLFFNTTDRSNTPRILRTEPDIKGLTFHNELTTNNTGRDNGYIYGAPLSYDRAVRGNIPGGRSSFSIKGDIPDPGMLLGETLADQLRKEGFNVVNVETSRTSGLSSYKAGKSILTHLSRPLKDIIREVNVKSNNHYAEHLIRTIGRNSKVNLNENALEAGVEIINEFWKRNGIDVTPLTMFDGSGLAPQNAVSSEFLTQMLLQMYNKSDFRDTFVGSLPKAGQEGTLRNFMGNSKYNGIIVAKSGSIGGVQCYAGYLIDGDKEYAFAVMVNKFSGSRAQVRGAIERLLNGL